VRAWNERRLCRVSRGCFRKGIRKIRSVAVKGARGDTMMHLGTSIRWTDDPSARSFLQSLRREGEILENSGRSSDSSHGSVVVQNLDNDDVVLVRKDRLHVTNQGHNSSRMKVS